jgi:hypothetical protein
MDVTNLVYWLSGYLEDRENLTQNEVIRVKEMIREVISIKPVKPSDADVKKMVDTLFPDLSKTNE